ncbi:unnamed protein product [Chrysoparadoxa australica]
MRVLLLLLMLVGFVHSFLDLTSMSLGGDRHSMGLEPRQSRSRFFTDAIKNIAAPVVTYGLFSPPALAITKAKAPVLCDDAVSHLTGNGQDIWLIGTAHISNASVILVENVISKVKPDVVMVELDASRFRNETTRARQGSAKKMQKSLWLELLDPRTSLGEKVTDLGAAIVGKLISGMYEALDKEGFVSGDEFATAIVGARQSGAKLLLGDRDVQVTLRHLSDALRQSDLQQLNNLNSLVPPDLADLATVRLDDPAAVSSAVELIKQRATVRKLTASLQKELPLVYNAMLAERDEFMANSLKNCPGKTFVAVVGIAHMDGIERNLGYKKLRC